MIEDTLYGTRDRRGHWTPNKRPKYAPLFKLPPQPVALARWFFGFPGYLWPWNLAYALFTIALWAFLTPLMETMKTPSFDWILALGLRNAALAVITYGGMHFWLYTRKVQKSAFKFNPRWPDIDNPTFFFGSQNAENIFFTMCVGVPAWTAYEVLMLWAYANHYPPEVTFAQNPIYFIIVLALIPLWQSFHFYVIHRLIHVGKLYDWVHKLHHNNVNPGPWSGLSMHPVECILYFSGVLIAFIIPMHPIHIEFLLVLNALTPVIGHSGFALMKVNDDTSIDLEAYNHYLHHKYFEVNYGTATVPFDELFGTSHDGSPEAEERMNRRLRARALSRNSSAQQS